MAPGNHNIELSEMLRQDVCNADGQVLGTVGDVVVHPRSGRVEYIRLQLDGGESPASASIDVPWSQFSTCQGRLVLDMSRDVLRRVAAAR